MKRIWQTTVLLVLFPIFFFCKPAELSNTCDPKSDAYLTATFLRFLTNDSSPSCLPGFSKLPLQIWGVYSDSPANVDVKAMAIYDNKLYLGGTFKFFGPNTGGAAILSSTDGTILDETVCPYLEVLTFSNVAISDENGGFYLAGSFTHVQGKPKRSIVHINANCSLDTKFDVGTGSAGFTINDIQLVGDKIYIAGSFTIWNGEARSNLAAVNRYTGALDNTWVPNASGSVSALAPDSDGIFVAGGFTTLNGQVNFGRLAKVNYDTGALVSSFAPNVTGVSVQTIVLGQDANDNKVLYAGGDFITVSPTYAGSFLMDGSQTSWNPAPNGSVTDIALLGSKVYLSGTFSLMGASVRNYFAVVDNNTGSVGTENLGLIASDSVASLTEFGGKLYVLGTFTSIFGTPRQFGFSIDPINAILTPWNPKFTNGFSSNTGKIAFSSDGSKVLVPGNFYSVNVVERNGFGSIDLITGKPTDFNPQLVGNINAFHTKDKILYVGGAFSSVLSVSRTNFFALNLESLTLEGMAPTFDASLNDIQSDDNYLYLGGTFSNVAGFPRNNLSRLEMKSGNVDSWNPNPDAAVFSLNASNDRLFVGGSFSNIAGSATPNLTEVSRNSTLNLLFPSNTNFPNANVNKITNFQNQYYIGGAFTSIGAQASPFFAKFDGLTGTYTYNLITADSDVSTISVGKNGKGIIGGNFTTMNGVAKAGFAFYDFNNDQVFGLDLPSTGNVSRSFSIENRHFISGKITQVGNRPKGGYVILDL
ncbi:hypothetical protein EHQ46_15625 [Leptospira yanagawae]|uniref:Uncharacterized protein n=1 Tax=Leptospira yanagawae TaxID=293069 RepID=A0ABY2M2W6_9LEPT|nr:hypothetical protein [Leptospira yanagawae]TGL19216.1 hypothetical protein EHQ46_15625 [Leptospira yanagawae]